MIKITALNKIYSARNHKVCCALSNVNLCLPDAEFIFLVGKSGSGKSTLLNLIGGLDCATGGKIEVDGNDLSTFSESDFADYRNTYVGFVFQDCHLIDELTILENVALSLNCSKEADQDKAKEALSKVGLSGFEHKYPFELSGGERQRVAIARAIVKKPRIILADEPTGNLDAQTGASILNLLKSFSQECLVFVVSHNLKEANHYADRMIELSQGRIISDQTKNPDFPLEVTQEEHALVYPDGETLSDKDIAIINETKADGTKFVKRDDRFVPTTQIYIPSESTKIQKSKLHFSTLMKLSGKFLKRKIFTIHLYAIMVAAIMIVMALAQTITAFDAKQIVSKELRKNQSDALYLTKSLTDKQKKHIAELDMVSDCFPQIDESDIQLFADAGYQDKIYPVLKYTINLFSSTVSAGMDTNIFDDLPYILEPLGTIVVDEDFLTQKYGEVSYLAKAEEFHPTGVIITDYIADIILLSDQVSYATDYESLIGTYHWGNKDAYNCVSRGYINGILDTGYRETYANVIREITNNGHADVDTLMQDARILQLVEDIHTKYGFCYSLNPNFCTDALVNPAWETIWHYSLQFDQGPRFTTSIPQVRPATFYQIDLDSNELLMEITAYNKAFGQSYTAENMQDFQPHTTQLSHYKYFEPDMRHALFSKEVKIVGLFTANQNNMSGTFIAGNSVYEAFAKDHIYATGLYFNNSDQLTYVLDKAGELGYQNNLVITESIHTMAQVVEAFVPIFKLFSIILRIAVIFILMNFASKMLNSKMQEIGILKALGKKNTSIGAIFGLQIVLIAVLTILLSTIGYMIFVGIANDLLIESLKNLVPNRIILNLDFLVFNGQIMVQNGLLIGTLAILSFLIPMVKIRALHPVKIIRTKE